MVVNLEGESRTIRERGPTFVHLCLEIKALEILAKKGERAHLAPLGKLEVTDGRVHREPEKDPNTRSGVRARLLKLCYLPIFRKTQLNNIIVTDSMHRRLEKNSVSGVES